MMLIAILFLLLFPTFAWAVPAFEVAASTSADPTGASMSVAISPSGVNRLLTSCLITNAPEANTTAHHFNTSETMTGVDFVSASDNPNAKVFYLINPTTGSHNLTAEFTDPGTIAILGAISFSGAHQTVPLGTAVTHGEINIEEATVTVTSAADELVFDCFAASNDPVVTIGGGQSDPAHWDEVSYSASGTTEAGAGSVVMNRTWTGLERGVIIGVSVKPTAAVAASRARRVIVIE
jgi:hypothetical protein